VHFSESAVTGAVNGALQDEMQVPPEQTTPEQMAQMSDEVMHDALGTLSEEEEGHGEEG
jgi:hypothetical protein